MLSVIHIVLLCIIYLMQICVERDGGDIYIVTEGDWREMRLSKMVTPHLVFLALVMCRAHHSTIVQFYS